MMKKINRFSTKEKVQINEIYYKVKTVFTISPIWLKSEHNISMFRWGERFVPGMENPENNSCQNCLVEKQLFFGEEKPDKASE